MRVGAYKTIGVEAYGILDLGVRAKGRVEAYGVYGSKSIWE